MALFDYKEDNKENQLPYGVSDFITFINCLEGYKTKIKNAHWSAENDMIHRRLDDLLDNVNDYQDNLAEEVQGIYGQFPSNVIKGMNYIYTDPIQMLEGLIKETYSFYKTLDKDILCGIRSETEVFIHGLNKSMYLFKLCKH